MEKVIIYALIDPITLKVRYIGRTKNSLEKRLGEHISKSKLNYNNTHKANWIKSLLSHNLKPIIRKLCIVEGWADSYNIERLLINKYKNRLLNHNDRGEGGLNTQVTAIMKNKISNKLKEYFKDPKNKRGLKEVFVYNLKGEFIKKFNSRAEAAKELKLSRKCISKCFMKNKTRLHIHGYQFSDIQLDKKDDLTYLSEDKRFAVQVRNNLNNQGVNSVKSEMIIPS